VIPLLKDPVLPDPAYIICDVGATIVSGHSLEPVEPMQSEIENKWPGSQAVIDSLKGIGDILYQEVPQQRRCSFFTNKESVAEQVKLRTAALGCDVIFSAGKFLDVLPGGVNKGSSLLKLVSYLNVHINDVLVAGDTMNDLSMYECGYRGVVVGNSEQKLRAATRNIPLIYYAVSPGAGGIMEAMRHFHFMRNSDKEIRNADSMPAK
jgi:3-deoxy-D-manno-octulosonate 8-phosphate phosphatase KdsC-like HAD superfamily phosphatase